MTLRGGTLAYLMGESPRVARARRPAQIVVTRLQRHQQAQRCAEQRRQDASVCPGKLHPPLWDRICEMLRMHLSPSRSTAACDSPAAPPPFICRRRHGLPSSGKVAPGTAGCGCVPCPRASSECPRPSAGSYTAGWREGRHLDRHGLAGSGRDAHRRIARTMPLDNRTTTVRPWCPLGEGRSPQDRLFAWKRASLC